MQIGMKATWAWVVPLMAGLGQAQPATSSYDVVVYAGTASGTIAAIAAAREGMKTALLEPGRHIGGMVSGGLGATDKGDDRVIGGLARQFYERAGKHYGREIEFRLEPHVAERIFRDWLKEARVDVFFEHRLDSVEKAAGRIVRIRTENGAVFSGRVFIDASYEGDLFARAKVSYALGREGRDEFGESLAGKLEYSIGHQFAVLVDPYDKDGRLLPLVYGGPTGCPGQGDKKIQAYNFRLCLSERKDNQVPFPRPSDYDPKKFELLRRYLVAMDKHASLQLRLQLMSINPLPNGKTDINNRGAISTDYIGGSWEYPEADFTRRREIWQEHKSYTQGFFYFLANDPSVPRQVQNELNKFGLCKDEFVDTDNWPHQLYVREARRMKGEYFVTQNDLQVRITKPDSVGMGSYAMDAHHAQRIPSPIGAVLNEGYTKGTRGEPGTGGPSTPQSQPGPYEIPYRAMTPKAGECENLLVPVCVSASHVAYASIRMEPQYMILGHSAGVAAALAIKGETTVQKIDAAALQKRLREQKQILSRQEVPDRPRVP
jgi:hypothetical protein